MFVPHSTADELLYHVDAQDQVIGPARREDIHKSGLMHRSVHLLVRGESGRILLQKRAFSKDENPGLWDSSAAGHVDFGESYDESARRELQEELGITVQPESLALLFKLNAAREMGNEFVQVYLLEYQGAISINTVELEAVRWFSPEQIDQRVMAGDAMLTRTFCRIWSRYRALSTATNCDP